MLETNLDKTEIMEKIIIEPGRYKHYKGNIYEVIGIAHHSESMEALVVYKATYQPEGQNLWVRPLHMFNETLLVDGKEIKRFSKL